jgi:hypothetical protein
MSALVLLVIVVVLIGAVYLADPVRVWWRYRGEHLVTCPETSAAAAVSIDVGRAAFSALVEGRPDLRLKHCSRWPARGGCDEMCLCEVSAHGRAGTVAAIVTDWCSEKRCAYCGKPIRSPASLERPAALVGPEGVSTAWRDVPAEQLPTLFATHAPACWSCHHVETFLREHKELVVER